MSNNNEYKDLKELITSISSNLIALENGNLSVYDLESLLDDARNIHERITILHYLAIDKEVKVGENKNTGIQFNFSTPSEVIPPNQTNLIDAIKVEHHIEAVRKSIGEQKPLFDVEDEIKSDDNQEPAIIKQEETKEDIIIENRQKENATEPVVTKDNSSSINDKFSEHAEQPTLADKLRQQPIEDLAKAIGLNQKFLFMNDLFEGENEKYRDAVHTINNFSAYIEADEYINNSLKHQYKWDANSVSAQKFIDLVKRRFV